MTGQDRRRTLAIVLAAGEGTRMRSATPKALHEIAGRPMLGHVLAAAKSAGADAISVVIGPGRDDVRRYAAATVPGVSVVVQHERLGTAHAVLQARDEIARGYDAVVVLFGDTPLVQSVTIRRLADAVVDGVEVAALGFEAADPTGYGRMLVSAGGLRAIREHKDATQEERRVAFCNGGLMALAGARALAILDGIGAANAQGEFYLTDAVEVANASGWKAIALSAPETEVLGVNDRAQLAQAEAVAQDRLRRAAMLSGVTLVDPSSVFFSYDTEIAPDALVEPHVVFGRGVSVASRAVIHAFSHLDGATVGEGATVGPFARLRPGAALGAAAKVGNFVEVKSADVGAGAKISHLSYIGDASVGANANIGAGVITCNYDGFLKHRTSIGAGAFVGSNSALVAPVAIGEGAYVGSGSVVTDDVPADALAIARGRQSLKSGWAVAFRATMSARRKAAASKKEG